MNMQKKKTDKKLNVKVITTNMYATILPSLFSDKRVSTTAFSIYYNFNFTLGQKLFLPGIINFTHLIRKSNIANSNQTHAHSVTF
jgi:hypothetical protein